MFKSKDHKITQESVQVFWALK